MSTTEPVFALRQLQEKCREKNKYLHMVFVDLEKAFDRIPRDLIWWCLRKKGVPEEYVQIVQDMYRSCKTQVVTQKGETEYFPIEVGLHQGSALSPLLFIIIMDVQTENIEKDPPWAMMFAEDLVLCAMTREEVEEDLDTWRVVFERHGLKISRTKTEYLPSPTNDTETTVKLVDAELPTVTSFKYLGSLFTREGGSQADVNNRIRIGWMKWKEVSGMMCDRKMPVELKDKVFKTIIRPAMAYGSECWAVKKKDESKLNSAEMRMLRWARGKTRLDHIRNEDIGKEAHVKPVETFLENKRLKWFVHCLRREPNHICANSLRLEVSGRRSRGRPKKRWRDNIQGDMKKYRLTEDMAQHRKYWMTSSAGRTCTRRWSRKVRKVRKNQDYTWPFILADVKTPLLGADFLQAYGLFVDLQSKRLVNATSFASSTLRQSNQTSLGLHHVTSDDPYSRLLEQFPTITRPEFSSKSVRHGVEHLIQTEGPPVHARARSLPPDKLVIAKEESRKMEDMGIIRRSDSPWSSPLHMVPKNSGGWRPCGDYRRLNDVTTADRYPVPHIQDFASQLAGASIFSKIDLVRGYHQIPVDADDVSKTSVITPFGLFEFLRTPYGLKNAAQAFQRLMDTVCKGLDFVFVYLDDILVSSTSAEQHMLHLREVFHRLSTHGLVINVSKCKFGATTIDYIPRPPDHKPRSYSVTC